MLDYYDKEIREIAYSIQTINAGKLKKIDPNIAMPNRDTYIDHTSDIVKEMELGNSFRNDGYSMHKKLVSPDMMGTSDDPSSNAPSNTKDKNLKEEYKLENRLELQNQLKKEFNPKPTR